LSLFREVEEMQLTIQDENFTKVTEYTEEEFQKLRQLLSFTNYHFIRGRWVKDVKYLVSATKKHFPTGLVPYLQQHGIDFEVVDQRIHWTLNVSKALEFLEEHQREVIQKAVQQKRCIVNLPTGAGKTFTYSTVCGLIDRRVAIVVPTKEILDQVVGTLKRYTSDFAVYWGSNNDLTRRIIISTAGTLSSRYQYIKEEMSTVEVLIADEAHYYGANSFFKVAHLFPKAHYRWGFSATPIGRSDNADLRILGVFSPTIVVSSHTTIDRIVPIQVVFLDYTKNNPAFSDPEDYVLLQKDPRRLYTIIWICQHLQEAEIPFLVFVDRIEVGEILSSALGLPLVTSTSNNRETVFQQIREGKLIGAVTTIGHVGLDIPSLVAIVNTIRDTTPISLGQRAGRVRRRVESKEIGVVFDLLDRGRMPSRWAKKRMNTYRSLGFTVTTLEVPPLVLKRDQKWLVLPTGGQ
jgi:superfamily II DNA or RNA helicase